jgi:hypothetical protein
MDTQIVNENESPPQARSDAERDLEKVAIALSLCSRPRKLVSQLAEEEIRSLTDRARLAINLGSQEALDAAHADVTLAISRLPEENDAHAVAALAIATWITSMSTQKGGV